MDQGALACWAAPKRSTPGGQPLYADLPIGLVLTLRLVFHLALRQAYAFARSVLKLLGLELHVPDHSTLSRRGPAFASRQPRCRTSNGPMHVVLDSTGLELFGQGEWDAAKHGRFMDHGRIVDEGAPHELFRAPSHPRTQAFLRAVVNREVMTETPAS